MLLKLKIITSGWLFVVVKQAFLRSPM